MINQLFTSINISRMPAIYWTITKSRKTKQGFAVFMVTTIRTISISSFNIPGVFMKIKTNRDVFNNGI